MAPTLMTIDFSKSDLPPYLTHKLSSLGIKSTDDLLSFLAIHFNTYVNTPTDELLALFRSRIELRCRESNSTLKFGSTSESHLRTLIDLHKSKICEYTFESLHKSICVVDDDESEDSIDIEDFVEPADSIDLDQLVPTETLFLRCIITSSNVKVVSVEEVLQDLEDEIYENLGEDEASEGLNLHYEDMLTNYMSDSEWPCDYPIYISTEFALQYPRIVNQIVSKAIVVIKSI